MMAWAREDPHGALDRWEWDAAEASRVRLLKAERAVAVEREQREKEQAMYLGPYSNTTDGANPRDCEHGHLRRKCQTCDDAQEIAALRAEVSRLTREIAAERDAVEQYMFGHGGRQGETWREYLARAAKDRDAARAQLAELTARCEVVSRRNAAAQALVAEWRGTSLDQAARALARVLDGAE